RWSGATAAASACPVCDMAGNHRAVLEMTLGRRAGEALGARTIVLLQCPACQARYCRPMCSVAYEEADRDGLKFYLEQGAGVAPMLEPLSLVDARPIARYLEIGCSFGFAMDYAHRILGWQVLGYDPGFIAGAGKELLGLPIENRFFDAASAAEGK